MMSLEDRETGLILIHQNKKYYLVFILSIQFTKRVSLILNISLFLFKSMQIHANQLRK